YFFNFGLISQNRIKLSKFYVILVLIFSLHHPPKKKTNPPNLTLDFSASQICTTLVFVLHFLVFTLCTILFEVCSMDKSSVSGPFIFFFW
ncbi:unnamed protein product, partial [Sphagnum compactum]